MLATIQLTEALAWFTLAVGFPLALVAAVLLRKKHREDPTSRVLRERYIVAAITAGVVLFFGLIFVQNDQAVPPLSLDTTKWITRLAMLALAVIPAAMWIWLYRSMRKPKDPEHE